MRSFLFFSGFFLLNFVDIHAVDIFANKTHAEVLMKDCIDIIKRNVPLQDHQLIATIKKNFANAISDKNDDPGHYQLISNILISLNVDAQDIYNAWSESGLTDEGRATILNVVNNDNFINCFAQEVDKINCGKTRQIKRL